MSTPKILWQTWKTDVPVPEKLQVFVRKWKQLHPDYEYYLLNDEDLRSIVSETVPQYLQSYDNFTFKIERVDFARYALLYKYGGVYADLDTDPKKCIDVWVEKNKIVLGCEPREHAENLYGRDRVVCNALMISPAKDEFWMDLMNYIISHYEPKYKPVSNTGPIAITKFLETSVGEKYISQIIITDPCVFFPLMGDNSVSKDCDIRESYVAHVWENTWVVPWYQNPMWFNMRYWTWFIIILVIVFWLYIFYNAV